MEEERNVFVSRGVRQMPWTYPTAEGRKQVFYVQYRGLFDKEEVRKFLQQKSNEMAGINPNIQVKVNLYYDSLQDNADGFRLNKWRQADWTTAGEPIELYEFDPPYDGYEEDYTIKGIQLIFTSY